MKKFNSQANALVHVRAHTQEKTYKCKFCSQAFYDSSTLKKHLRTHTGEKPYECKLCAKCFTQSGNLKRHLIVHEKYDAIQGVNTSNIYSTGITDENNENRPNMKLEYSEHEFPSIASEDKTEHVLHNDQYLNNLTNYQDYTQYQPQTNFSYNDHFYI